MNTAHNLFLLMFNLSQLHRKDKIITLFTEGVKDIFNNCNCSFSEKSNPNAGLEIEVRTKNSLFGYFRIDEANEIPDEHKVLINNAVLMLAVIIERLDFDQKLEEEKERFKKIADKRLTELRETIKDLQETKKASINLIEDLTDEIEKRTQSEAKLKESEARFRNLFETMAQGVVYQNDKGEITMANKAAEEILGLSFKQMIGKKSVDPEWKAVDKDKKELPGEKHAAMIALNTGKEVKNFIQGVYNPIKKDYVWIIVNSKPQFKKNSTKPYQVFSTFLDITDRKKAEDELRNLKVNLEKQIQAKTKELTEQVAELERFQKATIEREFRIKELRDEVERLKANNN